jgi:heat-inducible transcriptional repressor
MELTERQAVVLRKVVEAHIEGGEPVASQWVAAQNDVAWGPSTVRAELARLEEAGLLQHPHTSAGRVPTDRGYRYFVDELLEQGTLPAPPARLRIGAMRREVDEAMQTTTEQLSQVTDMLAIVSAPPIATTTIRRIEVLLLQPQVVMVVVITSTGGVTKRVLSYEQELDPGLVDWAGAYLNEALGGIRLGARMLHGKLQDPELSVRERDFLATLAPAFTELAATAEENLYVEGASRLFSEHRFQELSQLSDLMRVLERRVAILSLLQSALEEPSVYLRIGREHEAPELRELSLVAANYGLAGRNLGTVSVLGPMRMDYPKAIISVRAAAAELSRVVGEAYDE